MREDLYGWRAKLGLIYPPRLSNGTRILCDVPERRNYIDDAGLIKYHNSRGFAAGWSCLLKQLDFWRMYGRFARFRLHRRSSFVNGAAYNRELIAKIREATGGYLARQQPAQ